jgi:uncharacterized delta-60 repeat protein
MKRLSLHAFCWIVALVSSFSLHAQLALDLTFNKTGIRNFPGNKGLPELGGVRCFPSGDGSILIAGYHGPDSLTVIKLLKDGSLDNTFGIGGYSSVYAAGFHPSAMSLNLLVQRDKKIVVLANGQQVTVPYDSTRASIILLRLNANGSRDLSFGNGGLLIDRPNAAYQFNALTMAIDTTGTTDKLYVSSLATENGIASCPLGFGKWCISKYNADGSRDMTFNKSGYILQTASFIRGVNTKSPMASIYGLRVLPSGKLLAAGAYCNLDSAYFMFRMNADATLDNTFASNGSAYMPWRVSSTGNAQITSAHFLNDASVVMAVNNDIYTGSTYDSSLLYAVKFNNDGSTATSFGMNGILTTSYLTEGHHQITTDAADRLLLTWNHATATSQKMHFQRFLSNGKSDNTFGSNGQTSVEPIVNDNVGYAEVYNSAWTTDGKSLVVIEHRWSATLWGHLGVFRYNTASKAVAPTSVATTPTIIAAIFPQPATDRLMINLSSSKNATAALINATGQLVMPSRTLVDGLNTIDIRNMARGIYYLSITDASGAIESRKLIFE